MDDLYDFGESFYSVDEVTEIISEIIEGDPYLDGIWVLGEVASSKLNKNNLYFNLVGESSRLPCVLFGAGNFKLVDGEMVVVYGSVKVYRKGGRYNLYVKRIERTGTYGMKSLEFARLYQKLLKEGVFNRPKKSLSDFPYRIGLIVSKRSAALFDILKTFKRNGFYFEIEIFDTFVQGERAKEELVKAFRDASKAKLDAVIVARGGGSKDELWTFNDEAVVRAAVDMPHYLITGIGHEIDTVILDMIADERAHTPTAAAEVITSRQREYVDRMKDSVKKIYDDVLEIFDKSQREIITRIENIESNAEGVVEDYGKRLKSLGRELKIRTDLMIEKANGIFKSIEANSPMKILQRGYSIVLKGGKVVRSTSELRIKDKLTIVLKDGKVGVIVNEFIGDNEKT